MLKDNVIIVDELLLNKELRTALEDSILDYKESHNNELPSNFTVADALLPKDILDQKYIVIDGIKIPLIIFHLPIRAISTRGIR